MNNTDKSRKAWLSIFIAIVVFALSLFYILKIQFNNHYILYADPDGSVMALEKEIRQDFDNQDVFIAMFKGKEVLETEFLLNLEKSIEEIEAHPLVNKVNTINRLDHIEATEDGFTVERLFDANAPVGNAELVERVRKNRYALGSLVGHNLDTLAVVVIPKDIRKEQDWIAVEDLIRKSFEQHHLDKKLAAIAGQAAAQVADAKALDRDIKTLLPLSFLLGLIVLWVLYRQIPILILGNIAIGLAVAGSVFLYGLLGKPYSAVAEMVPSLIAVLTTAFLVHLFTALTRLSNSGQTGSKLMNLALDEVKRPSFFAAITTVGGFLSLAASSMPPMKDFGLIVSWGILWSYFIVMILLPPIINRWITVRPVKQKLGFALVDRFTRTISRLAIRHPVQTLVAHLVVFAASALLILQVKVEANFIELFAENHPLRVSTNRIQNDMFGTNIVEVLFSTDQVEGLKDPKNLVLIKEFTEWAKTLPEIDNAVSVVNYIEDMHWAFHGEKPGYRKIPENKELISQYLLINTGEDLYDLINRDLTKSRVILNANVHGSSKVSTLIKVIEDHLKQTPNLTVSSPSSSDQPATLAAAVGGPGTFIAENMNLLVEDQITSIYLVVFFIFVMLAFAFRSIKASIICLPANLLPVAMVFTFMGAVGISLDFATVMFSAITIGIAVDDTIHIFYGFLHQLKRGASKTVALARTYRHIGRAITATTIILMAQYLVFITSSYKSVKYFGGLMAIGITSALLFDLLLLPALIQVFWPKTKKPKS